MEGKLPPNIFEIAQKIAQGMPPPGSGGELDLPNMVKYVSQSVTQMMSQGEFEGIAKKFVTETPREPYTLREPSEKEPSNKYFEEIDDSEDADEFCPRTKDLHFKLNVDLEDFYRGKTKKLAITRKRIQKDAKGNTKVVEEKKKIAINIEPGMRDDQVIRFNKEADEMPGYETGDIVITLCENPHGYFERDGDNLFLVKKVSLYEALAVAAGKEVDLKIKHLDGSYLSLRPNKKALHLNDGVRKVRGEGMPLYKKEGRGDLYIRFNLVIPETVPKEHIEMLKEIFPVYNDNASVPADKVRQCQLEEVTEEDMEALDYDYSDSDYSESEYSESSESYQEPKKGEKRLPHAVEKVAGRRR
jgi:DnaJ-class molecular chaperone